MDSRIAPQPPTPPSSHDGQPRLWRDTPAAKAWFQRFGATWGGKDGLIAQAARQGKGQ